jgi:predicted peroxiredoxin
MVSSIIVVLNKPTMQRTTYFKTMAFAILFSFTALSIQTAWAQTTPKMKILIHVTTGTENPTKAALSFLVAKTAMEEGHTVSLFLAGDAVQLIRDNVLDNLTGLGTGKLREHFDALVKGGAKFYLSGNSSKARGVTDADIKGKPAEFALPNVLVKLLVESDRSLTY